MTRRSLRDAGRLGLGLTILAWIGLAAAPLVLDDWNIGLLTQYVTYGIFALSLGLIWGQAGILCFGQAIFFGIGAYSMALVTLGKLPWLGDSQWTGLALAVLLPMLVAAVFGWILFQAASAWFDPQGNIGWWAHLGGLATGAALTPLFIRRGVGLFGRRTAGP